jgi:hypothetical protein
MWKLYAQKAKGNKCEKRYEFANDLMKICFKHKIRMKVDHKFLNIKIV